jgi:hypothetical protein
VLDEKALGEFLEEAQRSLFRLETLAAYDVSSDGGDFTHYLRGEPGPDMVRKGAWHKVLQADRARGVRNYRVHVVRSPLSPYCRYECEWGYAYNVSYEDIGILDLAELERPAGLVDHDFWLVDDRQAVRMHYDDAGRYLGAEIMPAESLHRYLAAREAAWAAAVPFADYWAAHPQYHRGKRSAA